MVAEHAQGRVLRLLYKLGQTSHNLKPLKDLFWTELSYDQGGDILPYHGWPETAMRGLADAPILFATGGLDDSFHVIYSRLSSDRLLLSTERAIVSQLLPQHPYALFIFSNDRQDRWHFINVKVDNKNTKRHLLRRITIGPEERLYTASQRLAKLDLADIHHDLFGISALDIQQRHDVAFDVEAVTKQFFDKYTRVFKQFEAELRGQTDDAGWAHDFALQFLNRCMFLYFVQRKRWLGDNVEFLASFWRDYRLSGQPRDTFCEKWLKILFFEAFNNRFKGPYPHFTGAANEALMTAPYLNGGLFVENDLDRVHAFAISDAAFENIFAFLEGYNFTIVEDGPLDQEVAVDPEMIGKVYESLVNVSSETDERGDAGIFYTARTEIDLMCRLALVDYLGNHLGHEHKDLLYEFVFAVDPDDKITADAALAQREMWGQVGRLLRDVTVVDPACGSGAFPMGMLYILDDLQKRANAHIGRQESSFDRRRRIIGQSLYGVDVMDWACHVAELRMWLALVIDADFSRADLQGRGEPLLPHFSFKIRHGDSLVQEVGGVNLGLVLGEHSKRMIPREVEPRIASLKAEKLKFYENDPACLYKTGEEMARAEFSLFRDILDAQHDAIEVSIRALERKIAGGPQERQMGFAGLADIPGEEPRQMPLQAMEWQRQIVGLRDDLRDIDRVRAALTTAKQVPFVWDIAFVEIFGSVKRGFDIVIGNPPYVGRHKIRDPRDPADVGADRRKAYMAKLSRSVYHAFPRYFGLSASGKTKRSISLMSDLYIYFYFHGLSLLNPKGAFCFITSNSWLDVGYGADLQEFLLKHCRIRMIIDNRAKRSFASADVNTAIALLSAPDEAHSIGSSNMARFILFKVPFEQVVSPVIFEEIDAAKERKSTPEYQVYPIGQDALLTDGLDNPIPAAVDGNMIDSKATSLVATLIPTGRYNGNKWGGKYLRAPEIYHQVREKALLTPVQRYATARLGITTGANEFFFIRQVAPGRYITMVGGGEMEIAFPDDFTRPIVRSVSECEEMTFRAEETPWRIVVLPPNVTQLDARAYIALGERMGVHKRPFFKSKSCWHAVSQLPTDVIAVPEIVFARYFFLWNSDHCVLNKNFYGYIPHHISVDLLWGLLNCSFTFLQFELSSRKPGAGASGISVDVANRILVPLLDTIPDVDREAIARAGEAVRAASIREIWQDLASTERRTLDTAIYDALRLSQDDRDAIHAALVDLVKQRLAKADSLSA